MSDQEQDSAPQRRLKRKNSAVIMIVLLVFAALFGIILLIYPELFRSLQAIIPMPQGNSGVETTAHLQQTPTTGSESGTVARSSEENQSIHQETEPQPVQSAQLPTIKPLEPGLDVQQPAEAPASKDVVANDCTKSAADINAFFDSLDTKSYLKPFNLPEKSRIYFPRLIQKLLDNPPVVTGETDDLFTILQNTAHFFRILGKDNILILKGILDREKDTFESVLSNFYRISDKPECLKENFSLNIGQDALYQYAGFFLNTMGGRLYLFRRDSMSRMVVSYYSILVIDRANREGRNKYGIDLRPAIDALIEELESSSIKLQLRDQYLDDVYSLKERYQ